LSNRESSSSEAEKENPKTRFWQIKGVFTNNNTNYKSYSALCRVYLEKIDLKKQSRGE
jgi:hypothetical protein